MFVFETGTVCYSVLFCAILCYCVLLLSKTKDWCWCEVCGVSWIKQLEGGSSPQFPLSRGNYKQELTRSLPLTLINNCDFQLFFLIKPHFHGKYENQVLSSSTNCLQWLPLCKSWSLMLFIGRLCLSGTEQWISHISDLRAPPKRKGNYVLIEVYGREWCARETFSNGAGVKICRAGQKMA